MVCTDRAGTSKDWYDICAASPYTYRCLEGGRMTRQKVYNECEQRCRCHDMNPKPKVIGWAVGQVPKSAGGWGRRDQIDEQSGQPAELASNKIPTTVVGPKHQAKQFHPAAGFFFYDLVCYVDRKEDKTLTTSCQFDEWDYYCDLNGSVVVGNKARDACKRSCVCLPENIRPGVLNWDAAQPPRNGWRKRDADEQNELAATAEPEAEQTVLDDSAEAMSEDPSDALGHIVKKQISHDWAIVCEMDGKRHEVMTETCRGRPRGYSCDSRGKLTKQTRDRYCEQHCICVNLNPKPFIIGEPMPDWVLCSFCKRTSTDGDKVASESAAAPDTALEVLQSRDEVWVFDCNHEDGMQDLDLVRKCSLKHQVSCSVEGSLVSNEAEVSEQCQRSCLCYRRSVWV